MRRAAGGCIPAAPPPPGPNCRRRRPPRWPPWSSVSPSAAWRYSRSTSPGPIRRAGGPPGLSRAGGRAIPPGRAAAGRQPGQHRTGRLPVYEICVVLDWDRVDQASGTGVHAPARITLVRRRPRRYRAPRAGAGAGFPVRPGAGAMRRAEIAAPQPQGAGAARLSAADRQRSGNPRAAGRPAVERDRRGEGPRLAAPGGA